MFTLSLKFVCWLAGFFNTPFPDVEIGVMVETAWTFFESEMHHYTKFISDAMTSHSERNENNINAYNRGWSFRLLLSFPTTGPGEDVENHSDKLSDEKRKQNN